MLARQASRNADIVVTNQDLLVADLRAGGGALLPHPRDSLLVVDEAHSLPEKARKAGGGFGVELTSERLEALRRGMFRTLVRWHWTAGWSDARLVRRMSRSLDRLSSELRSCEWKGESGWRWRFPQGRVPASILSPVRATLEDARALGAKLRERRERLLSEVEDGRFDPDAAQDLAASSGKPPDWPSRPVRHWWCLRQRMPSRNPLRHAGSIGVNNRRATGTSSVRHRVLRRFSARGVVGKYRGHSVDLGNHHGARNVRALSGANRITGSRQNDEAVVRV